MEEPRDEEPGAKEDRERFEQLYRRFAGDVLAYALRRAAPEAAQDVLADTFLVAWRRLEAVPEDPLPWLFAVARRTLATQRRSESRRSALLEKLSREPRQPPSQGIGESQLLAALGRLPEREREALLLVAWEELRGAEAAVVLGCSPVAFRIRLHRARRRLARELDAKEEGARLTAIDLPVRELD